MSTEQCEELAQQFSDHSSSSTGKPVAEMNDESESRMSPNVESILTNPPSISIPVQGDLLRRHNKIFEILPEDIRASRAGEGAGFQRKISRGLCFMTLHDMDLTRFGYAGSCREYTFPRSDERSTPKGWIRGNTKISSVLEVKVTCHLYQHGIEIKVDSMKNDGSQSWLVISRRLNK